MMMATTQYVKEQCNRYNRIELADETKSLMRVIESVGQIARQLAKDAKKARRSRSLCADQAYVSGLMLMDETGNVL